MCYDNFFCYPPFLQILVTAQTIFAHKPWLLSLLVDEIVEVASIVGREADIA